MAASKHQLLQEAISKKSTTTPIAVDSHGLIIEVGDVLQSVRWINSDSLHVVEKVIGHNRVKFEDKPSPNSHKYKNTLLYAIIKKQAI